MKKLSHITNISFGFYHKSAENGDIPYLQVSQFDERGMLNGQFESFLPANPQIEKNLLKDGDILLAGKGFRNFAWEYKQKLGPMIASSIFFVIKPDFSRVHPGYLTVFLNLPVTQARFQILGAGSSIPSIRKGELGELKIPLPTLDKQKTIAGMYELHQTELALMDKIIEKKKNLFFGAVQKMITT
ncbi:MAG: restriction endonuclease subunit S [Bacteroidetes bacterium]|nr:restriction endonuclease subunit S [Bacteroidota bacterium]